METTIARKVSLENARREITKEEIKKGKTVDPEHREHRIKEQRPTAMSIEGHSDGVHSPLGGGPPTAALTHTDNRLCPICYVLYAVKSCILYDERYTTEYCILYVLDHKLNTVYCMFQAICCYIRPVYDVQYTRH